MIERRLVAWIAALIAVAAVFLAPRRALAWVEAHVEADEARVSLERSGKARVEHRITLRIAGGPLHGFDLRGVDADAAAEPDGIVAAQREAQHGSIASAVPVEVEVAPPALKPEADGSPAPTVLRVRFGGRGLPRGIYELRVRYTTDLSSRIQRDGRLAKVSWKSVVWEDGIDSAKIVFEVPSAPNPPRIPEREAGAPSPNDAPAPPLVLSNVRRGPNRDELELVRPYAPKGEALAWTFEADALAFAPVGPPPAAPKPTLEAMTERLGAPAQRGAVLVLAGALFLAYAALVARKGSEVARTSRAAGTSPRPLVPLPIAVRALLAGAALAAGVIAELLLGRPIGGAVLVTAAAALAAHKTPRFPDVLRGPGRWYPIATERALVDPARPRGVLLDVSSRAGKLCFVAALAGLAAAVMAVAEVSPFRAQLLAFDVTALLAVFGTGRLAELPPDAGAAPAPFLRKVAARLERRLRGEGLRLSARIRIPDGADRADELRLLVLPKHPPAGFVALEIGLVFVPGAGGAIGLPEILLRVTADSPAAAGVARFARAARVCRGRRATERVLAFRPRLPTAAMTADLAVRLARALAVPAADPAARPESQRRAA